MAMNLIDGKAISEQIKQEIAAEVSERVARGEKRPHLAAILVGHDGGSETYVANKVKACEACGFTSSLIRFESDVTEETQHGRRLERSTHTYGLDWSINQTDRTTHSHPR